jgi:hypothetical protein
MFQLRIRGRTIPEHCLLESGQSLEGPSRPTIARAQNQRLAFGPCGVCGVSVGFSAKVLLCITRKGFWEKPN